MIPAPPSPFPDVNRKELPAGVQLHRIHSSDFESSSFNPCQGRPSRFAPLLRPDGTCIPTAYAAETFECAVHETVFHEIPHNARHKSVSQTTIDKLDYAVIRPLRTLVLVTLHEPDLNKWGLSRRDLIDTYPTAYRETAAWAVAIHDAHAAIDGLVWTSRRCDPDQAYVFFGDRVLPDDLQVVGSEGAGSDAVLAQLRAVAARANIFIAV